MVLFFEILNRYKLKFSNFNFLTKFLVILILFSFFVNILLLFIAFYFWISCNELTNILNSLDTRFSELQSIKQTLSGQIENSKLLIKEELEKQNSFSYMFRPYLYETTNCFINAFNKLGTISSFKLLSLFTSAYLLIGAKLYFGYFGSIETICNMSAQTLDLFIHFHSESPFRVFFESSIPGVNITQIPLNFRYAFVADDFYQFMEVTKHVLADPITKQQSFNFGFYNLFSPAITSITKSYYYTFFGLGLRFLIAQGFYASYYEGGGVTTVDVSDQ